MIKLLMDVHCRSTMDIESLICLLGPFTKTLQKLEDIPLNCLEIISSCSRLRWLNTCIIFLRSLVLHLAYESDSALLNHCSCLVSFTAKKTNGNQNLFNMLSRKVHRGFNSIILEYAGEVCLRTRFNQNFT